MAPNGASISADNRGPWINIVTWILLVIMSLATFTKVVSKKVIVHEIQLDDAYIAAAAFLTLGYDTAISVQTTAGLGRHRYDLSLKQFTRYQKAAYTSQLFYVLSLCLARMAALQFLMSLARVRTRRLVVKGLMIFNCGSVLIAVFAVAFQCRTPHPWAILSDKCFNQAAFWDAFGVMDALLDVLSVVLPMYLMHDLQLPWGRKFPVIASFASRAFVVPIIVVRLVYLNAASGSNDHPFDDFATVMISSLQTNFSVIVTCIPFIKPVLDSLQSGILLSNVHTTTSAPHSGYKLRRLAGSSTDRSGLSSIKWPRDHIPGNSVTATGGIHGEHYERGLSIGSEEGLVIKQTRTVAVQVGEPSSADPKERGTV